MTEEELPEQVPKVPFDESHPRLITLGEGEWVVCLLPVLAVAALRSVHGTPGASGCCAPACSSGRDPNT